MKNFGTRLKLLLKANQSYIICASVLFCTNIVLLIITYLKHYTDTQNSLLIIITIGALIEIALCALLYYAKNHHWHIETIFLTFGLSIGTLYVFAIPLSCAPDENTHFFRIYEISKGQLVSEVDPTGQLTGSVQPVNVQNVVNDLYQGSVTYEQLAGKLSIYESDETAFMANTAQGYNVMNYLPHLAGMMFARIFNPPIIVTAYAAKLFHMITCVIILYFCIKYIPFLKRVVFVFAFFPIVMQGMTTLSADGFIISCSIALITYILYATNKKDFRFKAWHSILLLFLCLAVTLGKFIYAPLCLLLFTIPKERFGSIQKKLIVIFSLGIITAITLLSWMMVIPPLSSITDTSAQMNSLISNPFGFIIMLFRSLIVQAPFYIASFYGRYLEWFNLALSIVYIALLAIFTLYLSVNSRKEGAVSKSFKWLSIFAILFAIVTLFLIMYLQWTNTSSEVIGGVQGRYFLPLFLLVPLLIMPTANKKKKAKTKKYTTPKLITKTEQLLARRLPDSYMYLFVIFMSVYTLSALVCFHI